MNILQVIPYFPPAYSFGGPAKVACQISVELVRRGHDVTVYTTDAKDLKSRLRVKNPGLFDGVKVYYFRNILMASIRKSMLFMTPGMLPAVKDRIKAFDLIHLHDYWTFQNIIVHHYARKYRVPYVLEAHGALSRTPAKQWMKLMYDSFFGHRLVRDASKVVALSRLEARQYRDRGVPHQKIAVIPNGIDLSEYANLPPEGLFKKKFNIPSDKKIILYLGRIHRTKGIDFLIRAYAYLTEKVRDDDSILVIAGPDDGYLNAVKSLIPRLKLQDKVVFTGMLSEEDKVKAFVDSSLCAYLNPYEPFGIVPLEAAACETPVVVSRGTHMAEIIDEGNFGFSVKYGDVPGLAEIMRKSTKDDNLARDSGRRGREYIFQNFGSNKVTKRYEELYREVASTQRFSDNQ